jgi:hypothetical protein
LCNEYTHPVSIQFLSGIASLSGYYQSIASNCSSTKPTMLRKLSAIFLLLVFAWAQYVKQAIYLECRLAGSFKSYAVVCDCEKKAGFSQPGPEKVPLSNSHSHTHPDELYPLCLALQNDFSFPAGNIAYTNSRDGAPATGWALLPFQPPRHNLF